MATLCGATLVFVRFGHGCILVRCPVMARDGLIGVVKSRGKVVFIARLCSGAIPIAASVLIAGTARLLVH